MRPTRPAAALLAAAVALLGGGCRAGARYLPESNIQTGIASWYGPEFDGRPTSSHEIFDMNDLTAAHNTLPLGSYAMVTNLDSGRSVIVRINDRGPFVKNRVIDLSYAAARAIGLIGPGTAPVRVEVLKDVSPPASGQAFSVQVGAFIAKSNAAVLRETLERDFAGVHVSPLVTPRQTYFRVRVRSKSLADARDVARRLAELGYTPIIFEEP